MVLSNDWIGSKPVFYNTKTKTTSSNFNEVLDFSTLEWDYEGLYYYLTAGFSLFGKTPVKDVYFVPPGHQLRKDMSLFEIEADRSTPMLDQLERTSTPEQCIEQIRTFLNNSLAKSQNKITVVPLSGGFDSRLLLNLIQDKKNVLSYSYGISKNQAKSAQVVLAKKVAELMEVPWKQIQLSDFLKKNYVNKWYNVYGASTHIHGMYHIEFYDKLRRHAHLKKANLISGIIGDVWSGKVVTEEIQNAEEVIPKLTYNHGIGLEPKVIAFKKPFLQSQEEYFEKNRHYLQNPKFRILELLKLKVFLLRYLVDVPWGFGLQSISPFLDKDIALSILALRDSERQHRKWQIDFFRKEKIHVEDLSLQADRSNWLDTYGWINSDLPPLSPELLGQIVNKEHVNWINNCLPFGRIKKKMSWYTKKKNTLVAALNQYHVLYPIQEIIKTQQKT